VDNPVAIVPVIHDLVILGKKTLTTVGLRINTVELRQIIRLKKEKNCNRNIADLLKLSLNPVWIFRIKWLTTLTQNNLSY
jgi:hypothetical protein